MTGHKHKVFFTLLILMLFKVGGIFAQVISNFSPVSGPVGTSVNLYGSGFSASISGNAVYFGAAKASVTSASTSALTVYVPPGATYQPITVINTIDHVQSTSKQPFDVTFSPVKTIVTPADFDPKVNFTTGSNPLALTICDIDGDGRPDLITSNGDKTISILSSTAVYNVVSPGSFAPKYDLATGDNPLSIATGDIDGDGKPDIVVVNSNTTVSVYRNLSTNGNILFAPKVDIVINNPTSLKSVIINDLDGDGLPDLAFCSGGDVNVLPNKSTISNISFAAQKNFAANTSATSYITAGDIDGDGKPELLVTNRGNKTFSIFHNTSTQGTIKFAARFDYSNIIDFGYTAESIAIIDIDGDGKPEILTTYTDNANTANPSFVLVTKYKGGSISAASLLYDSKFNSDHSFGQIRIADVNGDGKPDIFTLDPNNGRITIQANISIPGSIMFLNAVSINTGNTPSAFEIGDLDGDGKPEIVVTGSPNTVSVFKNDQVLTAPTITSFTPSTTATATTVTIIGTNFTGATTVSFGNTPANSFTVVSATTINAVVTTGTTGKVRVTTPGGIAARDGFKFIDPPKIDYTTPNSYIINKAITPLAPTNSGGAIPATTYGETSVLAGNGSVGGNDGTGTAAQFSIPYGIATDLEGNIYITEAFSGRLRKITPGGVVTTIAPDAVSGTKYGTGPAQKFGALNGVVIDADGNVYVADNLDALIRKITPDGTVTTLAGNSNITSQDGQGTAAGIYRPGGMVMDKAGNIYFTDTHNKIREVSPTGYVSTFVGSGTAATVDGQYQTASFNVPIDLVMDAAGNMYVAEQNGRCIRKITPNGVVTTLAGDGQYGHVDGTGAGAQFTFLNGLTIDASGNLYATDDGYIRKITPEGKVTTIAGGGPRGTVTGVGSAVFFGSPKGITIGPDGNLYVVEQDGDRVKEVIATGYTIDKVLPAGLTFNVKTGIISGTPTVLWPLTDYTITGYNKDGSSIKVVSIEVKDEVVVPPPAPPKISYVTPQVYPVKTPITPLVPTNTGGAVPENIYGEVSTFAGNGQQAFADGQGTASSFKYPLALTADKSGNVYVVDEENFRIRKITPNGLVSTLAGNGNSIKKDGTGTGASFGDPRGIIVDEGNNLYVTESDGYIRKITPAGEVTTFAGNGQSTSTGNGLLTSSLGSPYGIIMDASGNIYIVDYQGKIRKITAAGLVTTIAGSGTFGEVDGIGTAAGFANPTGITVDKQGNLFVADQTGGVIRKITPAAAVTTFAGKKLTSGFADGQGTSAKFYYPTGICIDDAGNFYVADEQTERIRKITPSGLVTTLAGTGTPGNQDGAKEIATFNAPTGVAADGLGNLFVADIGNNLIRKVALTGYTIDKPLPPGLTFDAKTGTIKGTPLESSPATDYTVTAFNTGGSSSTVVNIKVYDYEIPPPALPVITYPTPQSYTLDNTPISTLFPTSTGGPITNGSFNSVITLAGSGAAGSLNGTGNAASFNSLKGLAVDNSGNIYIADAANNLIRKVSPTGLVTTFAGSGAAAFANGTGTAASFNAPFDVAVDAFGNVYVADLNNHRIRKITPAGVVTTIAGNNTAGSTDGAGTAASFNHPAGIAVDNAGNLYVTDNNLVRKITPGGTVTTLAGSGVTGTSDGTGALASFNGPIGIAVDANGYIYVADSYNNIIRKITPSGIVTTLAGSGTIGDADGTGTATSFHDPIGLKIDPYGNLYVTDALNNKIRKITPAGVVTTVTGKSFLGAADGDLATATFNVPFGIAIDVDGNLYIGDTNNNLLRKITVDKFTIDKPLPPGLIFDKNTGSISGKPTALSPPTTYTVTAYNAAGSGSTTISIEVKKKVVVPLNPPVITYHTPQIYTKNTAITDLLPTNTGGYVGTVVTLVGSGGVGNTDGTGTDASFYGPLGMVTDAAGNIYVADSKNNLIRKITPAGVVSTFAGSGSKGSADGTGTAASFNIPGWMAIDAAGNIYVSDPGNSSIRKISPAGVVTTIATGIDLPGGIAVDAAGNIFVAETFSHIILKITPGGTATTFAGSGNRGSANGTGTAASFNAPTGMAIDAAGNLYVADQNVSLIRKITPAGVVTTFAGTGLPGHTDGTGINASFNTPNGIVIDAQGNLYISDTGNNLVRKITPAGEVTTLKPGVQGDINGNRPASGLNYPLGIAVDAAGNIYAANYGDNTIRKVRDYDYTISGPLPPGLAFDNKTGKISGTPTAAWPATNYTITAYNGDGSNSTALSITVNDVVILPLPPIITYVTPQVYKKGTAISNLIPTQHGGPVPPSIYGEIKTFAGTGDGGFINGAGSSATFAFPQGLAIDRLGNVYMADEENHSIRKITKDGVVSTVAGIGTPGSTDGPVASASFYSPSGLTVDAAGNIYVADRNNHEIRKISTDGIVTTVAGNLLAGTNDGTGAAASFNDPVAIAIDKAGNLYVTDNNQIRKITSQGVVSSFAGTGVEGYKDGSATEAQFHHPYGITIDAFDNLYVADHYNSCIRKVTPDGTVTTVAGGTGAGHADGTGTAATFNFAVGVTVDALGNIYVGDTNNNLIRKIAPDGKVTTIVGSGFDGAKDGIGTDAGVFAPYGMVADALGNLYLSDELNNKVRKISLTGYTIDKPLSPGLIFDPKTGIISGTPSAVSPATDYTITAYNAGGSGSFTVNIKVEDIPNNLPQPPNISYTTPQVYTVGITSAVLQPQNLGGAVPAIAYGQVSTYAGTGATGSNNGSTTTASFNSPVNVAIWGGNLYVSDQANYLIRKITAAGVVSTFAGTGSAGSANGQGTAAAFNNPNGMTTDALGNLYIADELNNQIRKISPAGFVSTFAGSSIPGSINGDLSVATFSLPVSTAFDAGGNMYVADLGNNLIRKITPGGQVSKLAGSGTAGSANGNGTAASFNWPLGVAVDAGNNIYVADASNNQIRKITPSGTVSTFAGSTAGFADGKGTAASFNFPTGLAIDAIGNVFVGDDGGQKIRVIDPAGNVTTVAGSSAGYADGIGSLAEFNGPAGITLDGTGNLFVADQSNNVIRKVSIYGYTIDKALPPGLTFDPTNGYISGTPTAASPATDYTITAYNAGGKSSFKLNIRVDAAGSLTFNPIPDKTVCDNIDFDPGATSVNGGTINYASSNPLVATIVAGKIHIVGPGTTTITATNDISSTPQPFTVTAALVPLVTISPTAADDCAGASVTYTANPTNGGDTPTYKWLVNGQDSGLTGAVFMSTTLNDNDKITCVLTSSAACTTSPTATSNEATFTIDPPVVTSVTIASSFPGPICAGTEVVFTATPSATAVTPDFQWQVNGLNAGTNSATFSSSTFADGDIITCILTSKGKCLANPNSTSNPIPITLNPVSQCIIVIPNTFTPNGDGINDLWNISALVFYPGSSVNIFTRYGSLVYKSTGYSKAWDGTHNGNALPVGTYYYVIDLKNGKKPMSGPVTIIR